MMLVISRADGGVSIMRLIGSAEPATEFARWQESADQAWLPATYREADESELPTDRTDRDAWVDTGTAVEVDNTRKITLATQKVAALKAAIKAAYQSGLAAAERSDRAIVKLTVDELNVLRDWIMQFKAAVAGAATLAALKTAVAALPNTPARTYQQARTAYENAVDGDA